MTISLRELARDVFHSGFVKARTRHALRLAASGLLYEFRLNSLHRASLKKAKRFANGRGLRLHFGCGPNIKTGWVNIDLYSDKADLQLDAKDPFPFGACSMAIGCSEHL